MVYLLKMVIFHGELLNNQMVMRLLIFVGTSERERERGRDFADMGDIFHQYQSLVGVLEHGLFFSHSVGNRFPPTDELHHFFGGVG